MKKFSINWILPLILATGLFIAVSPVLAQLDQNQQSLQQYLSSGELVVGTENVDGHDHIFYEFNNEKVFITADGYNNRMPSSDQEYISFVKDINGEGQIFLYNILTSQILQLTHSSTNLEPKVNENGWVVWEGWVHEEDGWQVFLFDGTSVRQLTQGDLSMNPDIDGDNIVYSTKGVAGVWKAVLFSNKENKNYDIATGEKAREPKVRAGKIFLAQGKEEFPLTVEDLFVLNLPPLTATPSADIVNQDVPETVTEEQIIEELNFESDDLDMMSTPSAEPEEISTPSAALQATEIQE